MTRLSPIRRRWHGGVALLAAWLFATAAQASIHPSAPSASHALEEAAHALHEYLHDNYASGYGAHEFEAAAAALHHVLHEWSDGHATESQVVTQFRVVTDAWRSHRKQLRMAGLLHADPALKALFDDAKSAYKRVRFLLRKASDLSFINPNAPAAAHELEEVAQALHAHLHHHYTAGYGAHAFEEAAHALHEALHLWSQAQASEQAVAERFEAVKAAWKDVRNQLRKAGLLRGDDAELHALFEQARDAYQRVRRLLRKA